MNVACIGLGFVSNKGIMNGRFLCLPNTFAKKVCYAFSQIISFFGTLHVNIIFQSWPLQLFSHLSPPPLLFSAI